MADTPVIDAKEPGVRPDDWLERFEIDPTVVDLPRDAAQEPKLGAIPLIVGFEETVARLDPARSKDEPERRPPPVSTRRASILGLAASVALHFLPLLLLFDWSMTTAQTEQPIPVQLVLEPPPPPPPPPPPKPEEKVRPPGRLASDDMGEVIDQAKEDKVAAVTPPPKPPAPPELVSALPNPVPPPEADPLPPPEMEKIPPPLKPPVKQPVVARPRPVQTSLRYPGPDATRDEYFAYCKTMTLQHLGLLPPGYIGSRRGVTVLHITILANGTIARVNIAQSSGYSDIDARVEQMVSAVHRFPPLPQWIQEPSMQVTMRFEFPYNLDR